MKLATGVPTKLAMTPISEIRGVGGDQLARLDDLRQGRLPRGNEEAVAGAHEKDDAKDRGQAVGVETRGREWRG